jgi:uncharacterized membrane protein YheB (UPF0754 family)
MNGWWLLIPALTAFTGWITIRLAVSLFLKRVFPQQREQWTAQLAKKVSTEFISFDAIGQKITNPENIQKIMPQVEVHVDDFLRKGLPKAFPIISSFIGERTIGQLKEIFLKELETIFPTVMQSYIGNLEQELNLEQLIRDKVNSYSSEDIETAVYQAIGADLNKAAGLAALLGLLIGLVQLAIVWATVS